MNLHIEVIEGKARIVAGEIEAKLREELIRMGWTPPGEAPRFTAADGFRAGREATIQFIDDMTMYCRRPIVITTLKELVRELRAAPYLHPHE